MTNRRQQSDSLQSPASPLYLLDTNILIHYARRSIVGQRIESQFALLATPTVPLYCIVAEGEVYSIARRNNWGTATLQQLRFVLGNLRRLDLSAPGVLDAYVEIDVYSEQSGHALGKNDTWIAATANVTGATLLTTDRDFDHRDGVYLNRVWIDPTS